MFYGMLAFFLLDIGLVATRRIRDMRKSSSFLLGFRIPMPVFNALVGIAISAVLGMGRGDALLFGVFCASASDMTVSAATRATVPEANPGGIVPWP